MSPICVRLLTVLLLSLFSAPLHAATFEVSTANQLRAILVSSTVRPGDEILLKGGIYTGAFTSKVQGTPSAPVTVRSAPGEWAILDRANATDNAPTLTIKGSYVTVSDLEITNSAARQYRSGAAENDRGDGPLGINVRAANTRLINLVIHDTISSAIGLWEEAADSEVYGCILYNNGISKWDHGIYSMGKSPNHKLIRDNIIFHNVGTGLSLHAARNKSPVSGYIVEGNVLSDNGLFEPDRRNWTLGTGSNLFERVYVRNNFTYQSDVSGVDVQLKYRSPSDTVLFESNLFGGGALEINDGAPVIARWNTFIGKGARLWFKSTGSGSTGSGSTGSGSTGSGSTGSGSTGSGSTGKGHPARGQREWTNSRYVPEPKGIDVFQRRNFYDPSRTMVVVYNWILGRSVDLSVPALKHGQKFQVFNAFNIKSGPILSGVYDGSIHLPLTGLDAAQPVAGLKVPEPDRLLCFLIIGE